MIVRIIWTSRRQLFISLSCHSRTTSKARSAGPNQLG